MTQGAHRGWQQVGGEWVCRRVERACTRERAEVGL
jgi:hypothetical protein